MRPLVVLGYASAEARSKTRKRMTNLAARLGEKLALRVVKREVDLAWLSMQTSYTCA